KNNCAIFFDKKIPGKRREIRMYCDIYIRKSGLHYFVKYYTLQNYKN
ncbi:unnamed protein product, partial [Heterotrigona itama]